MRTEHLVRKGTNELPDLCGLLAYLAKRDRLAFAHADEPAAVAKRLDHDRAVLFVYPDDREIPVVANLLAGCDWVADTMGVSAAPRFLAAAREPLPTLDVASGPIQEIVHEDADLLRQLTIPQHNERDSGSYIVAGLLIAHNLKIGVQNVSIHRYQISGKNRIGVLLHRGARTPTTPSRRIGRAAVEWPQRRLAETAPLAVGYSKLARKPPWPVTLAARQLMEQRKALAGPRATPRDERQTAATFPAFQPIGRQVDYQTACLRTGAR